MFRLTLDSSSGETELVPTADMSAHVVEVVVFDSGEGEDQRTVRRRRHSGVVVLEISC